MSNRNLSPQMAEGMFGGPRGRKGNYIQGNINDRSGAKVLPGTTYGGQGLGMFWYNYPAYIGGLTDYNPRASETGSNVEAVQATQTSDIAGIGDGITAAY